MVKAELIQIMDNKVLFIYRMAKNDNNAKYTVYYLYCKNYSGMILHDMNIDY